MDNKKMTRREALQKLGFIGVSGAGIIWGPSLAEQFYSACKELLFGKSPSASATELGVAYAGDSDVASFSGTTKQAVPGVDVFPEDGKFLTIEQDTQIVVDGANANSSPAKKGDKILNFTGLSAKELKEAIDHASSGIRGENEKKFTTVKTFTMEGDVVWAIAPLKAEKGNPNFFWDVDQRKKELREKFDLHYVYNDQFIDRMRKAAIEPSVTQDDKTAFIAAMGKGNVSRSGNKTYSIVDRPAPAPFITPAPAPK